MNSRFDRHARGIVGMLVLQFLLGMAANLFVTFPETEAEGQLWQFAWSQVSIALHIILGLLLFVSSIAMAIRVSKSKEEEWKLTATVGLASIVVSVYGGATFVSTQKEIYSYMMAVGFIAALVAYGWGLYRNHQRLLNSSAKRA